jgi:hypothetical protein
MQEVINMRKVWKTLGVVGIVFVAMVTAAAYGNMENGGYANGCFWYSNDTDDTLQKAENLLKNAEIKEIYSYRFDTKHYMILKDGEFVGIIWKDINPADVSIGTVLSTKWGAKATLIYNGEVVGQIFVDGKPFGWQNTDDGQFNGCNGNGHRNGLGHDRWS